jgi:trimeric autotransporter adhesin
MTQTIALKDVRAEHVAQLQAAIDAATAAGAQAAADQAAAQQAVTADQAALAQLQSEAVAAHGQYATATMKLDQHSIELQLYENLTKQRDAEIKLANDQDQLAVATQQVQSLGRRTAALQAALTVANSDLSVAEQQDAAEADDRAALTAQVAGAVTEAGSNDVAAQVAAASGALATLVGGVNMVGVLEARYLHAQAIIGDKQRAVERVRLAALAVEQLTSAEAATLDAAAAGYDNARKSVDRWVAEGAGALTAAREALQQTIGTGPFSPLVSSDISEQAKTATDSGAAAADKAFHDAAAASIAADADLDAVTGPKAATDPGYDPAQDDTVKAQRDAADAATQALAAAQAARTPAFIQQMSAWNLSVPPQAFTLAIATFEAQSQIAGLAALDITALLTALDAAETGYAGALRDQANHDTLRQAAAEEQANREADAARYAAGADQRVLAVVRGDL